MKKLEREKLQAIEGGLPTCFQEGYDFLDAMQNNHGGFWEGVQQELAAARLAACLSQM